VRGGIVEASIQGVPVGSGAVQDGVAHVVATFVSSEPRATVHLRYVPDAPEWVPGPAAVVEVALKQPGPWSRLLAAGDDLSADRLIEAYRQGIFPWFNEGQPVLWWSPDPRMTLVPAEVRVRRSLDKVLRNRCYEVRADTAFVDVMRACAAPRDGERGTWISEAMISAYSALHRQGIAHSIETWIDGELAGGLYGVALGRMFYGESMFTRVTDASKIALVHLARQLQRGTKLLRNLALFLAPPLLWLAARRDRLRSEWGTRPVHP
jgi:leucyl/phenylalanyl-tRNA--protein transferase